ncbi:MAG: hypothetical protein GKR77_06540, partial [Legionellales bacterium]|nr:hypothetical protein [Legionellales bacterium]
MQHLQTMRHHLMWMAHWSLVATALVLPLSVTLKSILFPTTLILILFSCQTVARWQAVWRHPITWAVASLVGLILLGLLWSDAPWMLQKKVLLKYLKLLYIPILFLLAPNEWWRQRVINAFLIGVTVIVVLGYVVAYLPFDIHRIQQADWIAHSYIETGLMVAIAAYIYAWRAVGTSRYRLWYWVLVVVLAYYQFFINTGLTG